MAGVQNAIMFRVFAGGILLVAILLSRKEVELFFKCLKRRQKKKKSGGMQAPLLQNDTLEMIQMPPSSTDAESYSEISTKADVNIQVQVPQNAPPGTVLAVTAPDGRQVQCSVPPGMAPGAVFTVAIPDLQRTDCMLSVLEQVETFRVLLGFQIPLHKTADSDERTGTVLLQGSTFEVDKKAVRAKDNQVFLHALHDAVGEGWALQHHPKSGEAVCERAWSIRRSEVDFDELNQATNSFDQSLEIGDGGSCTVYRATIDSIPCAIKVLAENADEWDTKQFASEVNLLRRVQHSNLCRLYASSTNGPRKCLVLEHMGGGALDKRLVAQPPLGWQQRVSIALETCRGLDYLHSLNPPMIHRDVSELTVKLIVNSAHLHDAISSFPLRAFRYFVITRSRARTSS
jgi:hypothetical protein